MKRRFWFLLMLAIVVAQPGHVCAVAADLSGGEPPARNNGEGAEEQPFRKPMDADRNGREERRARRGIGADFWGGPYWGYGPRWGHPCEVCRTTCESDRDDTRCERCRIRCGW